MRIYDIKGSVDRTKSREWFENYCHEVDRKSTMMKIMIDNDEYVKWLDSFCLKYKVFYNDTWSSNKSEIDASDLEKVEMLDCMYDLIIRYADAHYIIGDDSGKYGIAYYMRYNDVVYRIGSVATGALFYCKRLDETEIPEDIVIIDFNDIKDSKDMEISSILREKLCQLSDFILELKGCGVSDKAIKETVEEALKLEKKK